MSNKVKLLWLLWSLFGGNHSNYYGHNKEQSEYYFICPVSTGKGESCDVHIIPDMGGVAGWSELRRKTMSITA